MSKEKTPKAPKGSVFQKEEPKEVFKVPDYNDEEKTYLKRQQARLERAKELRDQPHEEFDGLNYRQHAEANERGANTTIRAKKERTETRFQSGTLRTKMMAFLSSFQGLNLRGDISAFNEREVVINTLGNAMEDIIEKTEELENDEEMKMLRQFELLKQGHVFVEDMWEQKWQVEKEVTKGFYGSKTGVHWKTNVTKAHGAPKRRIVSGLSVYLGDMREYFIERQPYIFTVEMIPRARAEEIYEGWEMWEFVSRSKRTFSGTAGTELAGNAWRLLGMDKKGYVERVILQDKPNNEFQIFLNGVPMLPMGYPLTAITSDGEYTMVQQNLEPIRHDFAYGKSFIFRNKNLVAILDEMMKLGVLKTQKSFLPPRANLSGRVVSRGMFTAGRITAGVDPKDFPLFDANEAKGMTNSEFGMVQEMKNFINEQTVSPTFTGTKEQGQVTATQIIELQRQAKLMMGTVVLAASLLEKKLTIKRLMILLEKWFDPIDETLDRSRAVLKNRYRHVTRFRDIEGEGAGVRMVIPTEDKPSSEQILAAEEKLAKRIGMPVRMVLLNPKEIQHAKIVWVVTPNAKEKRSSELSKLMFRAMIQDTIALGLTLDPGWLRQRFATTWEEDPAKMFARGEPQPAIEGETAKGAETPKIAAQVKVPGPVSETLR